MANVNPPRVAPIGEARGNSSAGFSLVELLIATIVMAVGGLGAFGIIIMAVDANSRSMRDSTMTMLANAVIEQVNSTLVGSGTANLSDCRGTNFTIATAPGGAQLNGDLGSDIDFSANPPNDYHMDYTIMSPCDALGTSAATYDVRWHVDQVGAASGTPSNSFLVTVGAKRNSISLPMHVRVVVGRPE
jgi:prepilin-type N-terminal cleavage/methylation domain-containing protein